MAQHEAVPLETGVKLEIESADTTTIGREELKGLSQGCQLYITIVK
jgi:hypothetical protein